MKILYILVLLVVVAGSAFAVLPPNSLGVFFSDTEFEQSNSNIAVAPGTPFAGFVVLCNPTMGSIGGYEVGIDVESLLVTGVDGPNGWQNFGTNTNHLVGYGTPLPAADYVVFCEMALLTLSEDEQSLRMGPSEPSSVGGAGPAVADGANPDDLYVVRLTACDDNDDPTIVATVNGDPYGVWFYCPDATEATSWGGVKGLFE